MNPFRRVVDLAWNLRKRVLDRDATANVATPEEAAAMAARLRTLAADYRVESRRLGDEGGKKTVDTFWPATIDLFNALAEQRDSYAEANHPDTALPPASKLVDDC
jgi:hypothetical protein